MVKFRMFGAGPLALFDLCLYSYFYADGSLHHSCCTSSHWSVRDRAVVFVCEHMLCVRAHVRMPGPI